MDIKIHNIPHFHQFLDFYELCIKIILTKIDKNREENVSPAFDFQKILMEWVRGVLRTKIKSLEDNFST